MSTQTLTTPRTQSRTALVLNHETIKAGGNRALDNQYTTTAQSSPIPHALVIKTAENHTYRITLGRDDEGRITASCSCAHGTRAAARGRQCWHVSWLVLRSPELIVSLAPRV